MSKEESKRTPDIEELLDIKKNKEIQQKQLLICIF